MYKFNRLLHIRSICMPILTHQKFILLLGNSAVPPTNMCLQPERLPRPFLPSCGVFIVSDVYWIPSYFPVPRFGIVYLFSANRFTPSHGNWCKLRILITLVEAEQSWLISESDPSTHPVYRCGWTGNTEKGARGVLYYLNKKDFALPLQAWTEPRVLPPPLG